MTDLALLNGRVMTDQGLEDGLAVRLSGDRTLLRPRRSHRFGFSILALGLALGAGAPAWAASDKADIVPRPLEQHRLTHQAPVTMGDATAIVVPAGDAEVLSTAHYLQDLVARTRAIRLEVRETPPPAGQAAIYLHRRAGTFGGREAYDLSVSDARVDITAGAAPGLFYGAVTLWQLMTPDSEKGPVTLAAERIHDAPRFAWRGLMIDSARHYQSTDEIERMIDWMALHKLNVLHWHLTDDQGWRLQIRKYPRLTEVGAWRVPAGVAAQADIDPTTGRPRLEGGFYTQDQVRAIVAYAAERQIQIVPEIEMPGHALSAILAYPTLGSDGNAPASVQGDWGVFPYLYNTDEKTFGFLEDVLTEVMALFPSPFIHVGGDEAVKDQWKASPTIQAMMRVLDHDDFGLNQSKIINVIDSKNLERDAGGKPPRTFPHPALGVTDEDALQSWYTHRIDNFLVAHGRRLVGWDEIIEGGSLPASATVMSWRGVDGATTAAKAGHDAILSPAPLLYFDNRQGDGAQEPPGRGFVVNLKDVYGFDPAPPSLTANQRRHILGLQGNLWTEHIRTDERLTAMAFPRAAAVAEVGWSAQSARDWTNFIQRLPALFDRYRALGLGADEVALSVDMEQSPDETGDRARIALKTQIGLGQIRYTTDGSVPTDASPAYAAPLDLALPTYLRAAAFEQGRRISPIRDSAIDALSVRHRTSQELRSCSGKVMLNLEDDGPVRGPRARFLVDIFDPCWIYPAADLSKIAQVTVSVGQVPYNFQLGADLAKVTRRPAATPDGELEARLDRCDGPPAAVVPLPAPHPGVELNALRVPLPRVSGRHDLCFTFTAKSLDPMSVLNWVQLVPDASTPSSPRTGG